MRIAIENGVTQGTVTPRMWWMHASCCACVLSGAGRAGCRRPPAGFTLSAATRNTRTTGGRVHNNSDSDMPQKDGEYVTYRDSDLPKGVACPLSHVAKKSTNHNRNRARQQRRAKKQESLNASGNCVETEGRATTQSKRAAVCARPPRAALASAPRPKRGPQKTHLAARGCTPAGAAAALHSAGRCTGARCGNPSHRGPKGEIYQDEVSSDVRLPSETRSTTGPYQRCTVNSWW